jgi:hypothetical protein
MAGLRPRAGTRPAETDGAIFSDRLGKRDSEGP